MSNPIFHLERVTTPTGKMLVVTDCANRLRAVDWHDCEPRMRRLLQRSRGANGFHLRETAPSSVACRSLLAYFEGELDAVANIPKMINGTDFQKTVWNALLHVPAGHTISYSTLAVQIGRPTATRAVGLANGANPIPVFIPCHRVIGADGSLTGFGGGLERKRWLLAHESAHRKTTNPELTNGTGKSGHHFSSDTATNALWKQSSPEECHRISC